MSYVGSIYVQHDGHSSSLINSRMSSIPDRLGPVDTPGSLAYVHGLRGMLCLLGCVLYNYVGRCRPVAGWEASRSHAFKYRAHG